MRILKLSILIVLLNGCSNSIYRYTIYDMYSKQPINIDCAIRTIDSLKTIKKAIGQDYTIKFNGIGFHGELYHGGPEGDSFLEFGLTIYKTFKYGKSINEIAKGITNPVFKYCRV